MQQPTKSFCNFVKACVCRKYPSFYCFVLKIIGNSKSTKYINKIYILSLFFWYVSLEAVMVGDLLFVVQLNDGVQYHLNKWIQLGEYQPDVYHPHIGGGWKFGHHTKIGQ